MKQIPKVHSFEKDYLLTSFFLAVRPVSLPVQSTIPEPKRSFESNSNKNVPAPSTVATQPSNGISTTNKPTFSNEQNHDHQLNENLTAMITEQRRQNRLLEQIIAAINTSNALLAQLVQR